MVGEIGYSRQEFLHELKLWEIRSIITGYRKRERTTWNSARWQTYLILCGMGCKNLSSPQDLAEFSWDNEHAQEILTDEEIADLQRQIREENERIQSRRQR